jgi:hypothetical protein
MSLVINHIPHANLFFLFSLGMEIKGKHAQTESVHIILYYIILYYILIKFYDTCGLHIHYACDGLHQG